MHRYRRALAIYLLLCLSFCAAVAQQAKPATAPKTLPELQTRIQEILAKPELSSAMVGIKVASLDNGRVLFEENAAKLLAEIPTRYPKGDLLGEALWRLAFAAWRAERLDDAERWLDENLRLVPHEEIWYAEGRALYWKARIAEKRG